MNTIASLRPDREPLLRQDGATGGPMPLDEPGGVAACPQVDARERVRRLVAHCTRYKGADAGQALGQLANTLLPLLALVAFMIVGVRAGWWWVVALAIPAGGLMVRVFIIQHDCGHGSFLPSQAWNTIIGRAMSVLTLAPYAFWRRAHAVHHATSGNLDRRGIGDINTLTVAEFEALPVYKRLAYRIYRHPLFLFGFGVPFFFLIIQRLPFWQPFAASQIWRSVLGLNFTAAAFYGALIWLLGWQAVVLVMVPIVFVASAAGGWLFFVQHQFEETHWSDAPEWDYQVAAVEGSSFYELPKVLQWFTGNIGLHHIHHLCSMIPNYKLQACLDTSAELRGLNKLGLWESFKCANLALWDETSRRLVSFGEVRMMRACPVRAGTR